MYSLKLNKENFNKKIKFEISDEFFETYTFDRFENAKLQISLFLERKGVSSNYLLKFKLEGILLGIACDKCGDNLDFKIKNETEFIIKESSKIINSDDEIIFIDPKQKVIELNQFFYELIYISIPQKITHKNSKSECNIEMLRLIEKYKKNKKIDTSSWDKLKELKID